MWMKYQACYKHGKGVVEWIDIGENDPDEMFLEIDSERGDPEGFRKGFYEVTHSPPAEHLKALIAENERAVLRLTKYNQKLRDLLAGIDLP